MRLTYLLDYETGLVWSACYERHQILVPVLNFKALGQGGDGYEKGDFRGPTRLNLEFMPWSALRGQSVIYTRKVPVDQKNLHRETWGLKPLTSTGYRCRNRKCRTPRGRHSRWRGQITDTPICLFCQGPGEEDLHKFYTVK